MKFTLSLPPSINRTYGVSIFRANAMYKREVVKDWEAKAGWEIKQQLLKLGVGRKQLPFSGDLRVEVVWYFLKNRDIDSGIKILLDFLEDHKIYDNDKQIMEVLMKKKFDATNPRVEVLIELC